MQPAIRVFFKGLMGRWQDNLKHADWVLDDDARSYRYASITCLIEQRNIQLWLQPAYFLDLS